MDNEFDFELPKEKNPNENIPKEESLAEIVAQVNREEELRKQEEMQQQVEQQIIEEQKPVQNVEPVKDNDADAAKKNMLKLLLIIIILAAGLFAYRKYLDKDNKPEQTLSIEEQISATLNKRYGVAFTKKEENLYSDPDGNEVRIIQGGETNNKWYFSDDYLETIHFDKISNSMKQALKEEGIEDITIKYEPKKDCQFIGNCVDTYYRASYKENTDHTLLSERSSSINLEDYVNMSSVEFFNQVGFKLYIDIRGNFHEEDIDELKFYTKLLFNSLNKDGYKNKIGYEITFFNKEEINKVLVLQSNGDSDNRFDIVTAKIVEKER